jgi:hypothetical protein
MEVVFPIKRKLIVSRWIIANQFLDVISVSKEFLIRIPLVRVEIHFFLLKSVAPFVIGYRFLGRLLDWRFNHLQWVETWQLRWKYKSNPKSLIPFFSFSFSLRRRHNHSKDAARIKRYFLRAGKQSNK